MSERNSERIHFGTIKEAIEPPNLIEVQLNSYVDFLQKDVPLCQAEEPGLAGRVQGSFPNRELRRESRPRFQPLRNRRAEAERARSAARRPDLQRAASRHLPAHGGEGDQGRKSLHGRNPAHDAAGHVRDQRRRARGRFAVASFAGHCVRIDASISTARCFTASASFRIAVPGSKCSSIPAICSTSISIAANAAGNSWRRPSCARSATARTRKSSNFSTTSRR